MVVVTAPEHAEVVQQGLREAGETVWSIGSVTAGERGVEWTPS